MKLDILLAVHEDQKTLRDAFNEFSVSKASANFTAEKLYEDSVVKLTNLVEDYARQANSNDTAEKILSSLFFSTEGDRRSNISMPETSTFRWIFGEDEGETTDDDSLGSDSGLNEESDNIDESEIDSAKRVENVENRGSYEDQENARAAPDHRAKASELIQTWLRAENGFFYISGKVGSGKSTLMKFIVDHRKTKDLLGEWAKSHNRQLTIANFFFWNAGTTLQKTHEGLLRSLLFQVLNQCRDLIPLAIPERWKADNFTLSNPNTRPWTLTELSDVITRVVENASVTNGSFCFFIDGLDEYQGEHRILVKDIKSLCASPFIKICVSSRPWTIFEEAFGKADQTWKFKLQDCTKSDIHKFVQAQLAEDDAFKELVQSHGQPYKLIEKIERQADGVFLWVKLVVGELHTELSELGTLEELEERVDSLPPDLDSLFKHILDRIGRSYRQYMAQLLLLCYHHYSLPLVCVHFLFENRKNPGSVLHRNIISVSAELRETWEKEAKGKVNKWCRDLLQVRNIGWMRDETVLAVEFSHRSVKDFLQQGEIKQYLYGLAGSGFDPDLTEPGLYLALIKCLDDRTAMSPRGDTRYRPHQPFFTKLAEYTLMQVGGQFQDEQFGKHAPTANGEAVRRQLVEEIDQTCMEIWIRNGKGPLHWTVSCLRTKADNILASHSTFLVYTLQKQLLFYIEKRIAEMSDEDFASQGPYLLLSCLYRTHHSFWSGSFHDVSIVVRLLLRRGVDVNAEIEIMRPSSREAESSELITRTVWEMFLESEHEVCQTDYVRVVHLLLEAKADVHCALPEGFTSLGNCLVAGYTDSEGSLDREDTRMFKETLSSFAIPVFWNEGISFRAGSWDGLELADRNRHLWTK